MQKLSAVRFWSLLLFSRLAADRQVYKWIARHQPQSILEIGLSSVKRSLTLIQVAQRFTKSPAEPIKYTGIDLFEGRAVSAPGLTLKESHRQLGASGAKVRLLPGSCVDALSRQCNQWGAADLVMVTHDGEASLFEPCWYFLPRVISDRGAAMLRIGGDAQAAWQIMTAAEARARGERTTRPASQAA